MSCGYSRVLKYANEEFYLCTKIHRNNAVHNSCGNISVLKLANKMIYLCTKIIKWKALYVTGYICVLKYDNDSLYIMWKFQYIYKENRDSFWLGMWIHIVPIHSKYSNK